MKFTRRDAIKGMGAAGLTPLLLNGCGGDGGSGLPPLPELPEYMPPDTPGPANMFEHGVAIQLSRVLDSGRLHMSRNQAQTSSFDGGDRFHER